MLGRWGKVLCWRTVYWICDGRRREVRQDGWVVGCFYHSCDGEVGWMEVLLYCTVGGRVGIFFV